MQKNIFKRLFSTNEYILRNFLKHWNIKLVKSYKNEEIIWYLNKVSIQKNCFKKNNCCR